MTRTPHRSLTLLTAALVGAAMLLATACGPTDPGDDMTSTPVPASVSYEAGILRIGDVALPQFPDYRPDDVLTAPVGWPVLSQLAIQSRPKPLTSPEAAAAVLKPDVLDAGRLLELAEAAMGLEAAPVVTETTVTGSTRTCVTRIRAGHMDGGADKPEAIMATIIAEGPGSSRIGITLDLAIEAPQDRERLQQLTTEVVSTICRS